jgi:two-component system OmpR family response regulator
VRLLVIEDHQETAAHLVQRLGEAGYCVDHASDGVEALANVEAVQYDVLLVDLMLPRMTGADLISQLRAQGNPVPAIILSALDEVDDRIRGLRVGADDYLVKPFALAELLARIEAVLRRAKSGAVETTLRAGNLELNLLERSARRGDRKLDLQPQEFRLLEYLLKNAGNVVTRRMVFEHVWNYHFDPQTNIIEVHISRLRAKVDVDGEAPLITTVRGAGYRLQSPAA